MSDDDTELVNIPANSNKRLGADLWLAARNGEFDKVQALVARGAPVNFKVRQPLGAERRLRSRFLQFVSRQPKMRPYPLHVAVFRNRSDIVRFLLSKGADPTLRNYRKETAMDIARQNDLTDMLALLERGPTKILPDRASTAANRERDIKQVRKQAQPDEALGPVSKEEIVANIAKYKSVLPTNTAQAGGGSSDLEEQIRKRQEDALLKKENAIRARKEKERQERVEEERIYAASLANAGADEKKLAAALLEREAIRKKHDEQRREWDRQRAAEEEEGRRALEALERKRQLAAQGLTEEDTEAARAKEDFERREREAVAKALAAKKAEAARLQQSPRGASAPQPAEDGDDDPVPPPVAGPPPSWSDEDDVQDADSDVYDELAKTPRGGVAPSSPRKEAPVSPRKEAPKVVAIPAASPRANEAPKAATVAAPSPRAKEAETGPPRAGGLCKARFAYAALRSDELSFKKNQVLEIVTLDPKGKWHTARIHNGDGTVGKVPGNYF